MINISIVNDIKIGLKVIGCFTLIFAVAMVLTLCAHQYVSKQDSIYRQYTGAIKETAELKTGIGKMEGYLYHYIAAPAARNNTVAGIKQEIASIDQIVGAYQGKKMLPEEMKILSDFTSAWSETRKGSEEIMKLADEGKNDEAQLLLADPSRFITARNNALAAVGNLNDYNTGLDEAAIKANASGIASWAGILWLLLALEAVLLIVMGIIITESITNTLNKGVLMMREMKNGHLSNRLHLNRRDEIGDLTHAMDQFAEHLQKNVIFNMQQISEGNIDIVPVIADDKDEMGPALQKMTENIRNLIDEISELIRSSADGILDVRGKAETFNGAYRDIVAGINKMLDAMMDPIGESSTVLVKMAQKDLTVRMKGDYKGFYSDVSKTINKVVENLDKALQQVAIGAEQVSMASLQVSTGGQSLSQGASEQASSLEEVSSSLQEMSSMTRQNAQNAREAKGVSEQARESADKGVESMSRMSSAINQIKSSSDSTAKIVKTIDEIAFQTNLLALNAAVEAARAGDAGRGFAVVAEEVRNLAMRSAEAAKNTASLIEDAVKNSENGVAINAEVLKNFQDIVEKSNQVSHVVAEIAAASEQQDQGISQVTKAVEQLNQLTQQNAANAEESASAAEEMSSQSEEMRSMIEGFTLSASAELTRTLSEGRSGHLPHNPGMPGQRGKAAAGFEPDPRKVIPLDESDHNILKNF
ncbi:MAG: methyl-accepting chemotaxis protein [Smithella sp.]